MVEIVTERLTLRPLRRDDAPAFAAYRSDPEVARFQTWEVPYPVDEAVAFIASLSDVGWGEPGAWLQLGAVDRDSGVLHGDCGVRIRAEDHLPATAEVAVTFARPSQRRGLATEALGALVARLFEELDMHRVFAETDDRNAAVHRLFERLGFRCEARLVEADWFKGEWVTLRVYALLRRERPGVR